MQLSFDLLSASPLSEAHSRLLACFGPQRDEKRLDPVNQLVKSILGSQTYEAASAVAYLCLRAYLRWAA